MFINAGRWINLLLIIFDWTPRKEKSENISHCSPNHSIPTLIIFQGILCKAINLEINNQDNATAALKSSIDSCLCSADIDYYVN